MAEITYSVDGDVPQIPEEYSFFPSGDHFLTRRVKKLCKEHSVDYYRQVTKWRNRFNAVGYHAPSEVIELAKQMRDGTEVERSKKTAERLMGKPEVVDAVKRYVESVGDDQANEMLNNPGLDDVFQVLQVCNGNRIAAQIIVGFVQRAQLSPPKSEK